MNSKEYGSDFHIIAERSLLVPQINNYLPDSTNYYLSGRAALYAILEYGISEYGWNIVYLPSYYCKDVNKYIDKLPIKVEEYQYNPFGQNFNFDNYFNDIVTSVIINVDYFGLGSLDFSSYQNIIVIDDLTHNLERVKDSTANYIFGSLRKILPIPTGGFLASNKDIFIPFGNDTDIGFLATIKKITAMSLKKDYIDTGKGDKNLFRQLYIEGEVLLNSSTGSTSMPLLSKSFLKELDVKFILDSKRENINQGLSLLKVERSAVLNTGGYGLGLIFALDSKVQRDSFKSFLVSASIYPAVLWPNQSNKEDIDAENKMLFIHLDYRYSKLDVEYIINKINSFFEYDQF